MKNIFLIYLFAFLFSCSESKPQNDVVNSFFDIFEEKGSDQAIGYLFSTNKWNSGSEEQIKEVKKELKKTTDQLGKFYGFEYIGTTSINDDLIQYTYLVKYDRQPLRFTFTLYKPVDKWQIQNFHFDYNIIEELKEKARVSLYH